LHGDEWLPYELIRPPTPFATRPRESR
jgi:hypothetical protein